MKSLITDIKNCQLCQDLPHGINPIITAHKASKIAIIGQAPGKIVHETSIPWNDKSGDNLRNWLDVDKDTFYDETIFSLIPMGFCYPGTGKSGDLPPRKICAPTWHPLLLEQLINVDLFLLVGKYAQDYYLKETKNQSLTETVRNYKLHLPTYLPLPHPSPRNNIWKKKNPWFEREVLPELKSIVRSLL